MATLRSDVIIALKADTSGVDEARRALFSLRDVTQGAGLAVGALGAAGALNAVTGFIKRGVDFNAQLETAQIGIAAIFKQFDTTGRFADFSAAMGEAGKAVALLRKEAESSPATFSDLLSSYQATTGAMTAAGIPMERQVVLVNRLSQALAALGIRSEQLTQETRALVTGNITEDAAAARILGISRSDIDAAKEQGRLYEFLNTKTAAFGEAGKRAAGTYAVAVSNLNDALDALASKLAGPLSRALTAAAGDLQKAVGSLTAEDIKAIAEGLADAARLASLFAAGMLEVAKHGREIVLVLAALKTAQIGVGVTQGILSAGSALGATAAAGGTGAALAAGGTALSLAAATITVAAASISVGALIGKSLEPIINAPTLAEKSAKLQSEAALAGALGDEKRLEDVKRRVNELRDQTRSYTITGTEVVTPEIRDADVAIMAATRRLAKVRKERAAAEESNAVALRKADADAKAAAAADVSKFGSGATEKDRETLAKLAEARARLEFKASSPEEQKAALQKAFSEARAALSSAVEAESAKPTSANKIARAQAENNLLEAGQALASFRDPATGKPITPFSPGIFADSLARMGGSLTEAVNISGAGGASGGTDYVKAAADESAKQTELLKQVRDELRKGRSATWAG